MRRNTICLEAMGLVVFLAMHKNRFWVALLCAVLLISIYFFGKTGLSLYSYFAIGKKTEAKIEKISVKEMGKNQFALLATFSFNLAEKSILGEGAVGPLYPNPYAASMSLPQFENKIVPAWYKETSPDKAKLQRKFPTKLVLSTLTLFAIVIYFIFLGQYVGKSNAS